MGSFHKIFSGTMTATSLKDEALLENQGLRELVVRSVRMSLQLQKEVMADLEFLKDLPSVHEILDQYSVPEGGLVICPEVDPEWSQGIMADKSMLLSFRYNQDDSSENKEFFMISLRSTARVYRVHKVNREAVRGFWAAQQQEVGFYGDRVLIK